MGSGTLNKDLCSVQCAWFGVKCALCSAVKVWGVVYVVWYRVIQCSAAICIVVLCGAVKCCVALFSVVLCCEGQCGVVQCWVVWCCVVECKCEVWSYWPFPA